MKCPKCLFENPDNSHFCNNCGIPVPISTRLSSTQEETRTAPDQEFAVGNMLFKKYQVLEELGRGGMGRVYKVLDKEIKEEIALKLINPDISTDERTIERFRNELKLSRQISHRNVCRMYEFHEEEGQYYITMEYVPGEDLKTSIKRIGPLTPGKFIFIAKQICAGLAEAHRLGVIHRDLKPRNIMIDKEGNVRIMDFGIARSLRTEGVTDTGVMIGTPEYMSPEQVEGRGTDHRSDIYSLGIILFEMLTGELPFQGKTPISVALKHKTEFPPDPKDINAQIPEELSQMILKCLEKDKSRRYQSIQELHSELSRMENRYPTTGRVMPDITSLYPEKIKKPSRFRTYMMLGIILIAIVVAGILLWRFVPSKPIPSSAKPSLAVMYFENNTGDENLNHWRKALCELLTADLSQSRYIKVLSGDQIFQILRKLDLEDAESFSSDDLKQVAALGGVNHILRGSLSKAGNHFRVNAMLHHAGSGDLIGSESVEGRGEESIFAMVDELTRHIKTIFRFSRAAIASDIDREVGTITTKSPEAYRYYIDGRRYLIIGDNDLSAQFLKKAIAIDSEFAMAHRGLAIVYGNLGYRAKQEEHFQKAISLTDRISDRERYLIQGDYYKLSEKTYHQAVEAYRKVLEIYPDDLSANVNLGNLYRDYEQWDKAIERFEAMIMLQEKAFYPYNNLAKAYEALGKYEKAAEILEDYLDNQDEIAIVHGYLALNYLIQGKYEFALKEADKAFSLDPDYFRTYRIRGDIYHCQGNLSQAEEEYKKLLEEEEKVAHLIGRSRLASLYLTQGRYEESLHQLQKAIVLAETLGGREKKSGYDLYLAYIYLKSGSFPDAQKACQEVLDSAIASEDNFLLREAYYCKGFILLYMNDMEKAEMILDRLEGLIHQAINPKEKRLHDQLVGIMHMKRDELSQAVEYLKEAVSLLPFQYTSGEKHALFIESLAFAYYRAGDLERAQKEYEKILSLTLGRLEFGDIYAKSFYMLGKIHQESGRINKSREYLKSFLDLWKESDQNIPEVQDAKNQLALIE